MSRYGSVTLSTPSSLLTRIVESADPADLEGQVTAAIAALPGGSVVVGLTLAGAGDGATFTVTIEAGAAADVTGGFASPPTVTCFLASTAEELLIAAGVSGLASGIVADVQVAGASKGTRFMGMRVKGTVVSGDTAVIPPLSDLWFVDINTTVPLGDQNGSIAAPYSSLQIAFDAGRFRICLLGEDSGAVVPPGVNFVLLTAIDPTAVADALTLPDDCTLFSNLVAIGDLTAGDNCQVFTNKGVGTATFGSSGIFVPSGPGAVSFGVGADQLALGGCTMGGGNGTLIATNTVVNSGATITARDIGLFGCQSRGSMTSESLDAQNCTFTEGTYTTTGEVDLQDVKCSAGVAFDNAVGQPFNLDGFSNYWIKTNAVGLTNAGEKVITEDLTP